MKKSSYIERAEKFAALLEKELSNLGYDYDDSIGHCNQIFINAIHNINTKKSWRARPIVCGSTRNVVLCSDYCIKVDKNLNSYWGDSQSEFQFFWNYKDSRFGPYLCPIAKVSINNYDFYIMPKVSQVGKPEVYDRFPAFIRNNLRDLHEMNIGILHGRPVVIDYAAGLE